jgi:hypothetical protein
LEYAKLEKSRVSQALTQTVLTFAYVAELYINEVVPTKAHATQKDNARELKNLLLFFNDPPAPLEAIEPKYVGQYLRHRGKAAPIRANREKSVTQLHLELRSRERLHILGKSVLRREGE